MARVTVEDCVEKVDNRFELVALAAQRAKTIASGGQITIERDNDKDSVVALREIAHETVAVQDLREQVTQNYQMPIETDEEELVERENAISEEQTEEAIAIPTEAASVPTDDDDDDIALSSDDDVSEMLEDEMESDFIPSEPLPGSEDALSFEEDNIDIDD